MKSSVAEQMIIQTLINWLIIQILHEQLIIQTLAEQLIIQNLVEPIPSAHRQLKEPFSWNPR